MRAVVLVAVVAASMGFASHTVVAQGAPSGKDGNTAHSSGPDTKAKNEGRVGSLSPDEARRAARARERAEVAAQKAAGSGDRGAEAPAVAAANQNRPTQAVAVVDGAHKRAPHVMAQTRAASRSVVRRVARADLRRRRALAGNAARSPSIGDVIPGNVPLYPLPFGYNRPPRLADVGPGYGAFGGPLGYRPAFSNSYPSNYP